MLESKRQSQRARVKESESKSQSQRIRVKESKSKSQRDLVIHGTGLTAISEITYALFQFP